MSAAIKQVKSEGYPEFLERKSQLGSYDGFDAVWMPGFLFDFQRALVEWALQKGKSAIFADCGLGKTPMQLVWAENVVRKTNGRVLILTPLAVGRQTLGEAEKFSIEAHRSTDGSLRPGINIANYERLHYFSPEDFQGVVCDESSILKHFSGATQKSVTRFMSKMRYRLLCTATAAPNDYIELGTSSEALGELSNSEMLTKFFSQSERKPCRIEDVKQARKNRFAKLSFRVSQSIEQWHLKPYAETHFWRWVCSWARACRQPSDLGFADDGFILPELIEKGHTVKALTLAPGLLFERPAIGLHEEREERRRTIQERCDYVAKLVDHTAPSVVWCHLNDEGDRLEKAIAGARQIKGSTSDEEREELYEAFSSGQLRKLVIKPKIGAWGLNWQHCSHVVSFAAHSYEQYYQAVRRCWRFGQQHPVTVDIVSTEGEAGIRENMKRKADAAVRMFANLVTHMNDSMIVRREVNKQKTELPTWL
ncbi:MAG: helicase [Pyrinomonadaceae bacterium]|nr:helicase [Pyrinomonadaceae bacterium]